jgi:hypothetical protein
MLIGYAADHTGDTYKMFDLIAKTMRLSCDIKAVRVEDSGPLSIDEYL